MKCLLITPGGELTRHDGNLDWASVVGPEGRCRVALVPGLDVGAYVNDVGLRHQDRYPRNEIGSCLLVALGARIQPYAGTVVLVGWNAANTLRGRSEIVSMRDCVADSITEVHGDVRRALAGDPPRELSPSWGEQMREVAEHVRTAPTPGLTLRTVTLP